MTKERMRTRVRYIEDEDSFIYELWSDEFKEWEMVSKVKCVRREGAKEDEDTNYIPYSFMKTIVRDCQDYDTRIHFA